MRAWEKPVQALQANFNPLIDLLVCPLKIVATTRVALQERAVCQEQVVQEQARCIHRPTMLDQPCTRA